MVIKVANKYYNILIPVGEISKKAHGIDCYGLLRQFYILVRPHPQFS
jgi:hypothetical protein